MENVDNEMTSNTEDSAPKRRSSRKRKSMQITDTATPAIASSNDDISVYYDIDNNVKCARKNENKEDGKEDEDDEMIILEEILVDIVSERGINKTC